MIYNLEKLNEATSNPLVSSFLADSTNKKIFYSYISNPDEKSFDYLNERFQIFYTNVKRIKYISTLIRVTAIDFDKRYRKHKERFQLSPQEDEFIDKYIVDINFEEIICDDLWENNISDQSLLKAIKSLSKKQRTVLKHHFINERTNKEIAKIQNTTEQNVSQIKKKGINKLCIEILGEEEM